MYTMTVERGGERAIEALLTLVQYVCPCSGSLCIGMLNNIHQIEDDDGYPSIPRISACGNMARHRQHVCCTTRTPTVHEKRRGVRWSPAAHVLDLWLHSKDTQRVSQGKVLFNASCNVGNLSACLCRPSDLSDKRVKPQAFPTSPMLVPRYRRECCNTIENQDHQSFDSDQKQYERRVSELRQ